MYIGGFGSADNEEPAAADVHGLIRGGGVWSASGQREARERELRPAAGGGTGIWKGQE